MSRPNKKQNVPAGVHVAQLTKNTGYMSDKKPYYLDETPDEDIGEVSITDVDLGGCSIKLALPTYPERLLDLASVHEAYATDEYMPYWATLWPVSKFLAAEILKTNWQSGLRAIEVGCGLGLPGIAALKASMEVVFTDYDSTALKYVRTNCSLNGLTNFKTALLDMRAPGKEQFDVVIASDMLYERRNLEPLVELLDKILLPGGTGLFSDQNRPFQQNFLELLTGHGYSWKHETNLFPNLEGKEVTGSIFSIKKILASG